MFGDIQVLLVMMLYSIIFILFLPTLLLLKFVKAEESKDSDIKPD